MGRQFGELNVQDFAFAMMGGEDDPTFRKVNGTIEGRVSDTK